MPVRLRVYVMVAVLPVAMICTWGSTAAANDSEVHGHGVRPAANMPFRNRAEVVAAQMARARHLIDTKVDGIIADMGGNVFPNMYGKAEPGLRHYLLHKIAGLNWQRGGRGAKEDMNRAVQLVDRLARDPGASGLHAIGREGLLAHAAIRVKRSERPPKGGSSSDLAAKDIIELNTPGLTGTLALQRLLGVLDALDPRALRAALNSSVEQIAHETREADARKLSLDQVLGRTVDDLQQTVDDLQQTNTL